MEFILKLELPLLETPAFSVCGHITDKLTSHVSDFMDYVMVEVRIIIPSVSILVGALNLSCHP